VKNEKKKKRSIFNALSTTTKHGHIKALLHEGLELNKNMSPDQNSTNICINAHNSGSILMTNLQKWLDVVFCKQLLPLATVFLGW
jgi:hypothetical protein